MINFGILHEEPVRLWRSLCNIFSAEFCAPSALCKTHRIYILFFVFFCFFKFIFISVSRVVSASRIL